MGYPLNEYLGPRAQYRSYLWLRHDYVETALAELGDTKAFSMIAARPDIQKLQIIGGKGAVEALLNSQHFNPEQGAPFMKALSQMVQNPSQRTLNPPHKIYAPGRNGGRGTGTPRDWSRCLASNETSDRRAHTSITESTLTLNSFLEDQ